MTEKAACYAPYRKPVSRWANRLPYRVPIQRWIGIVDLNKDIVVVSDEFKEWAKEFGIGPYEVLFWGDILEMSHCAANDIDYPEYVWFTFANENDMVYFKLRWCNG